MVELAAGDLLLLEGAWHQPRDISGHGSQRLVVVCFFHEQSQPQPQPQASGAAADGIDEAKRETLRDKRVQWAAKPTSAVRMIAREGAGRVVEAKYLPSIAARQVSMINMRDKWLNEALVLQPSQCD